MNTIAAELTFQVDLFIKEHSKYINWNYQSAPEKWSPKQILGHLTDSAHVNLQRFIRCTYESEFDLYYDQNKWVDAQHYQDANITELIELWRLTNSQIVIVLNNYSSKHWQATCNGHTAEFLATDYVDHMRHHLNQIQAIKLK